MTLRRRALGRTGLQVSEIAFGCGENAGVMVGGTAAAQDQLVGRALDLGVTLFDTSPAYGLGASEENLGRALASFGATQAQVMTKAYVPAAHFDRITACVTEGIDASLRRLRRDRLDILLLHNPLRAGPHPILPRVIGLTPAQALGEALPAMIRAREAGKVGCIGIACDDAEPAMALPVIESGQVEVIDLAFNLANPSAARTVAGVPDFAAYDGLLAAAQAAGVGFAAVRPLAGGGLARRVVEEGVDGLHPLSQGYFRARPAIRDPAIAAARRFAALDRPGQSLAQAAWRFVLQHPAVSTVVGGFSDALQLEEAVAAAAAAAPLSAADRALIDAVHDAGFA